MKNLKCYRRIYNRSSEYIALALHATVASTVSSFPTLVALIRRQVFTLAALILGSPKAAIAQVAPFPPIERESLKDTRCPNLQFR